MLEKEDGHKNTKQNKVTEAKIVMKQKKKQQKRIIKSGCVNGINVRMVVHKCMSVRKSLPSQHTRERKKQHVNAHLLNSINTRERWASSTSIQ